MRLSRGFATGLAADSLLQRHGSSHMVHTEPLHVCYMLPGLAIDRRPDKHIVLEIMLTKELCARLVMLRVGGMTQLSKALLSAPLNAVCRFFWSFDKINKARSAGVIGLRGEASVSCNHRDFHRRVNDANVQAGW
jgi:hypothetical protein